jgi:hypothetical protein
MTYVVEAAPLNSPTDPDASLTWVDITSWVNDNLSPVVTAIGRQTELSQVDPGRVTLTLNNQDDRFTPGNPTSPYTPGWRTGMRLRCRDTLGARTFEVFDGWLLQPETIVNTTGLDQTVTVTVVDRLARLRTAGTFISTLTEWVRYNSTGLVVYYPLVESSGATQALDATGTGVGPLVIEGTYIGAPVTHDDGVLVFGGASPPPAGDDMPGVMFSPILDSTGTSVILSRRLANRAIAAIPLTSNDYLTVAAWLRLDQTNSAGSYQVVLIRDSVFVNSITIGYDGTKGMWQASVVTSAGFTNMYGGFVQFGAWQFVAVRLNNATGAIDMWVDQNLYSSTTGGASTGNIEMLVLDSGSPGQGTGHVQIHAGADAVFNHTVFTAQRQAGLSGLAGQLTGARIATVAQYAGMSASELGEIDPGVASMQMARLAGRSPLEAMQEAEVTEQGLLHAYGRRLLFHDRLRRYNR